MKVNLYMDQNESTRELQGIKKKKKLKLGNCRYLSIFILIYCRLLLFFFWLKNMISTKVGVQNGEINEYICIRRLRSLNL